MKKIDVKTEWSSSGKTLNGKPFLSVHSIGRKHKTGRFYYAVRGGSDSVAFVLYDKSVKKFGLIKESKPPLYARFKKRLSLISAFGGSIDMKRSKKKICQIEVKEESGFEVKKRAITKVGKTHVSTQMNQIAHLYIVDVTKLKAGKTEMDIHNEKAGKKVDTNEVVWLSKKELIKNAEWKSVYIFVMAKKMKII